MNILSKLINKSPNKSLPDPKNYSTVKGAGTYIPCQLEAYFLCLKKYVKAGDHVLDVGFGLGYGINTLSIVAESVSGIEVDKKVYDYCQDTLVGRNPKLRELKMYDGAHIPYKDSQFDVVTLVDVLEHVEDYNSLIHELIRVSKRGVFVSTPNRRPEYTNDDGTPRNVWHLREWSRPELHDIIVRLGYEVEWNHLDGPFEGPFNWSAKASSKTLTLSPYIHKS